MSTGKGRIRASTENGGFWRVSGKVGSRKVPGKVGSERVSEKLKSG